METKTHAPVSAGALLEIGATAALLLGSALPHAHASVTPEIELELLTGGVDRPSCLTHAGDGSGRLFLCEQTGAVRIFDGSQLLPTPFLDVGPLSTCCGEQGLLSLAFAPDYASSGELYVHYSDTSGDTVIARFTVHPGDPDVADPASRDTVLWIDQPDTNHNGGQLAFGPDGYLYIGLGDGGGGGDPYGNGQDPVTLLGAILRVDVGGDDFPADPDRDYAIPPDNPFVGDPGAADEIWAWGLRNPWRFSFDRSRGDLFIADVGQNQWEEVDFQPADDLGGRNYGWPCYEGNHPFDTTGCADPSEYVFPILEYSHSSGCSITGGYRYRGLAFPNLVDWYLYADYCTGTLWGARPSSPSHWSSTVLLATGANVSSFGEDETGELYLCDRSSDSVYRIVDISPVGMIFADGFESADVSAWSGAVGGR